MGTTTESRHRVHRARGAYDATSRLVLVSTALRPEEETARVAVSAHFFGVNFSVSFVLASFSFLIAFSASATFESLVRPSTFSTPSA